MRKVVSFTGRGDRLVYSNVVEKNLLEKIYQTDVWRLREFLKRPLPWQFPKSNIEN